MQVSLVRELLRLAITALVLAAVAGDVPRAQSGGPISLLDTSPRIEQLKRDVAAGVAGAEDRFWSALAREHTPIVEPVAGDARRMLVTLVWRNTARTQSVKALSMPMTRVESTDVWYLTFAMIRDHRLWYSFTPVVQGASGEPEPQPDPLNPHRFAAPVASERPASAVKSDSPLMRGSIVVTPDMPMPDWVDPQPGVPAGRVEERAYDSRIYGGKRRVWVYTPPAAGGALMPPVGLLICLWGQDYLNEIPVPTMLDNLQQAGRLPPIAAIFVDNSGDRFQDFQSTQRFTASFAGELLPWVRAELKLAADPRRTIVAGYSAAGLESAYIAQQHPDLVGGVLSQSGAFWRAFEGTGATDPEWITGHVRPAATPAMRFVVDVGGAEDREMNANGLTFKAANAHLRDALRANGYDVEYREVAGGEHEFIHWRSTFGDGLLFLTRGWR